MSWLLIAKNSNGKHHMAFIYDIKVGMTARCCYNFQSRLKGLLNFITKHYMIPRHRMITIDCIVIITSLVCNIPSILLENSTLIGKVPWPCILAFVVYMVFRICKLDSIYKTNKEIFSHCQSLRKYTYLDYFHILLDFRTVYCQWYTVFSHDVEY